MWPGSYIGRMQKGPRLNRGPVPCALLPQAARKAIQLISLLTTTTATSGGGDAAVPPNSCDMLSNNQNGRTVYHIHHRRDRGACRHGRRCLRAPGGFGQLRLDRARPPGSGRGGGSPGHCRRRRHPNWTCWHSCRRPGQWACREPAMEPDCGYGSGQMWSQRYRCASTTGPCATHHPRQPTLRPIRWRMAKR